MPARDLPDEIIKKIESYVDVYVPSRLELLKRRLSLIELKDVAKWIEMLAKNGKEIYLPEADYKVSSNQAIYICSLGYTIGRITNGYYVGSDYEAYSTIDNGFIIKI